MTSDGIYNYNVPTVSTNKLHSVGTETPQPNGSMKLLKFLSDSRLLLFPPNLLLAYYLIFEKPVNVSEAAWLLQRDRKLIRKSLENNPCFTSKEMDVPFTAGGRQRRIILSEAGRAYSEHIVFLAEYRLPYECKEILRRGKQPGERKDANNPHARSGRVRL